MRTYTYNDLSGIIEIKEEDGSSTFSPLSDFIADLCEFSGIGFGNNGIISSSGPFSGEMKSMSNRVIALFAKNITSQIRSFGEMGELVKTLKPYVGGLRQQIIDIEIDCRLKMFQHLRDSVRSEFNGFY